MLISGLVQERHISIASSLELSFYCTNLSIWSSFFIDTTFDFYQMCENPNCHDL